MIEIGCIQYSLLSICIHTTGPSRGGEIAGTAGTFTAYSELLIAAEAANRAREECITVSAGRISLGGMNSLNFNGHRHDTRVNYISIQFPTHPVLIRE